MAESEGLEPPIPFGMAAFKAVRRASVQLSVNSLISSFSEE